MSRKLISIVTPTYNEEDNIDELYQRITASINPLKDRFDFEIIVIDNASQDSTIYKLHQLALLDHSLKVIVNVRNFGHIRSPYYGLLQANGEAIIYLASDLQDPPELIKTFIESWEKGFKLVMAVKPTSQENPIVHSLRRLYYRLLDSISEIPIIKEATGFGLYDKEILDILRDINDPYPFFRGLIAELGYPVKQIEFNQPRRLRGISKNNIYTLYDIAWLGIVGHSKLPIRISAFFGFFVGSLSILSGIAFLILKLLFWNMIPMGIAPLAICMFLFFGFQFIFIGILGEYVGSILTYVQRRPIVVEQKRINFTD